MPKPTGIGYFTLFSGGTIFISILLAISIVSYTKTQSQSEGCSDPCISDTCISRQCLQNECKISFVSPFCCYSIDECQSCDPFGLNGGEINYFMEQIYTNAILPANCTNSIYIQDSIVSNNELITKCFSTYPNSRCNSTFGVVTVNRTTAANFIEANNLTFVNINNFLIAHNVSSFNGTAGVLNTTNLILNGTAYVNELKSCVNASITIGNVTFQPNGTVILQSANISLINIDSIDNLNINASATVQGILITNGSVQGYSGSTYSNMILNPVQENVAVGYSNPNSIVTSKLNVNGTVGVDRMIIYPNNCTNQSDCTLDTLYKWNGNASLGGGQYLPLKFFRLGRTVWMNVGAFNGETNPTKPLISISLRNSTIPTLNYQAVLPNNKIVNKMAIGTHVGHAKYYMIMTIDTMGVLTIAADPYVASFPLEPFIWNNFVASWTLYN